MNNSFVEQDAIWSRSIDSHIRSLVNQQSILLSNRVMDNNPLQDAQKILADQTDRLLLRTQYVRSVRSTNASYQAPQTTVSINRVALLDIIPPPCDSRRYFISLTASVLYSTAFLVIGDQLPGGDSLPVLTIGSPAADTTSSIYLSTEIPVGTKVVVYGAGNNSGESLIRSVSLTIKALL